MIAPLSSSRRLPVAVVAIVAMLLGVTLVFPHIVRAQRDNPLFSDRPGANRPQHIVVAASVNASEVKPGAAVTLVVDVTPNPGIHVYAPGAKGYEAIALTVAAKPQVTLGKTIYPKSELVLLAPLNERVAVYEKPFRMSRVATLAPSSKAGTRVTLTGAVDYQACDDKVCFIPASIPVSWSVMVK